MTKETPDISPFIAAPSRIIAFDGATREDDRVVAVETPVQITFADVPFAVMMLTPMDLVDFAYGFSLTEGLIESVSDIRDVTVSTLDDGLRLRIALAGDKLHAHLARQRAMTGRTGCGVCGIGDIEALRRAQSGRTDGQQIDLSAIERALTTLDQRQALNQQTRAVHAAAWANASGEIVVVREDVGRHNALDKLIGALLLDKVAPASGFVVITSRCSFEMVEKAAVFGAQVLVAISAPTSLAIRRAEALGLTLIAIARRDTLSVFHGGERLKVKA